MSDSPYEAKPNDGANSAAPAEAAPANPAAHTDGVVPPTPALPRGTHSGALAWLALLASLAALGGVGYQWWRAEQQSAGLRLELAQRLQSADQRAAESQKIADEARRTLSTLQQRFTAIEAKVAESQTQQVALESLYQTLLRNRDDWSLAEVEQIVNIAAQQLQLAGNVKAAIVALEVADARLARMSDAQLAGLRLVIQQDLERLKSVPLVDTQGMALRIERMIALIDDLPLGYLARPPASGAQPPPNSSSVSGAQPPPNSAPATATQPASTNSSSATQPQPASSNPSSATASSPQATAKSSDTAAPTGWRKAWAEFKGLVRVQPLDQAAPPLLAPEQSYFLRENLKLRLQSARLAVTSRDNIMFQSDLRAARDWLKRYFDPQASDTVTMLAALDKLLADPLVIAVPDIQASLNAIHDLRIARERNPAQ